MTSTSRPRLASVDVLRGATMAAMILVNNPGSWTQMFDWLRHAPWDHPPALADYVFPSFLFLVGVSTVLALRPRRLEGLPSIRLFERALRRSLLLIAIGLFLNLFPHFDLATVRLPGILQRIALVALACAGAELWLSTRSLIVGCGLLLLGYNVALVQLPIPGVGVLPLSPETSWPVWLDERVFGAHRWPGPGDPEGLLSTLGAIVTGWMGVLAGRVLLADGSRARRCGLLFVAAVLVALLGFAFTGWLPISKELWTAPYTLWTAAVSLLALSLLHGLDFGPLSTPVLAPLRLLGKQALLAYTLAHLLSDLSIHLVRVPGGTGTVSLHIWWYSQLCVFASDPLASLYFALSMLVCVGLFVALLDHWGLRIRL